MTLCTNLIQHIRTPVEAVSHLRRMFDLIAAIFSQTHVSSALSMLYIETYVRYRPFRVPEACQDGGFEAPTLHI